ncbi:MAG: hypothetical protein GF315_10640 [candidate division Zixibacteria bacterium]|nr:hypothetical protein [candidate division Zixibacteria bacterium]
MKRWIKYFIYAGLGFIALILLLLVFTQTPIFRNILKDRVVSEVNKSIDGQFSIDEIDGSLFGSIVIEGIMITRQSDTLLSVPRFSATYDILPLIFKEIQVNSVSIESPFADITRLSQVIVQDTMATEAVPAEDTGEPSLPDIELIVDDFSLVNGSLLTDTLENNIPDRIDSLNIMLSAYYSPETQSFHLGNLNLNTVDPALSLEKLAFELSRDEDKISLSDFIIVTSRNQVSAEGFLDTTQTHAAELEIETEPIQFREFRAFLPALEVHGDPVFVFNSSIQRDTINIGMDVREGEQSVRINAEIAKFSDIMTDSTFDDISYDVEAFFSNVDVTQWTGDPANDYLINGVIRLNGKGVMPKTMNASFNADFSNSVITQRPISSILINGELRNRNLRSDIDISGNFGTFKINSRIKGITTDRVFRTVVDVDSFNLAALMGDDSLSSDINLKLTADGRLGNLENPQVDATLAMRESSFRGMVIDSINSYIDYSDNQARIQEFVINSEVIDFSADGEYSTTGYSDIDFQGEILDVSPLSEFIDVEEVAVSGEFSGSISGRMDSLTVSADIHLNEIKYDVNKVEELEMQFSVLKQEEAIDGTIQTGITGLSNESITIENIELQADFTEKSADLQLEASVTDTLELGMRANVVMDSTILVTIPALEIDIGERRLTGAMDSLRINSSYSSFHVANFRLNPETEELEAKQAVSIDGIFSLDSDENLSVEISNWDVGQWASITNSEMKVDGKLNFDLQLEGTAQQPLITGELSIDDGILNEYKFKNFSGSFDYRNDILGIESSLIPKEVHRLKITGEIPMEISLAENIYHPKEDGKIKFNLRCDSLPLTIANSIPTEIDEIKGRIVCDLNVGNTLNDPELSGFFRIENGAMKMDLYGVDYSKMVLNVTMDSSSISLDSLKLERDGGFLKTEGNLVFEGNITEQDFSSVDLSLRANKFFLVKHYNYELQFSADTYLRGEGDSTVFGGDIKITRSKVFLPAVTGGGDDAKTLEQLGKPMLISAMETDTLDVVQTMEKEDDEEITPPEFLKEIKGQIKLEIPKNTWIKSPDMLMELAGDLDVVIREANVEPFGDIRIVRGHYDLLGKRFKVEEGQLIFEGGEEINPRVILEAVYTFRTASRDKEKLHLHVSGKAKSPQMKFTLGETEIDEGDAISYIMFGKSLDELTYGQREGMQEEGGDGTGAKEIANQLAASMLSSQLTKTLGKQFNLDMVEVNAEDNWEGASFVVGKYLTNDLFMSYQKGFGETQDGEAVPEIVTLEYEVIKNLFLQLIEGDSRSSGFDVIIKLEK